MAWNPRGFWTSHDETRAASRLRLDAKRGTTMTKSCLAAGLAAAVSLVGARAAWAQETQDEAQDQAQDGAEAVAEQGAHDDGVAAEAHDHAQQAAVLAQAPGAPPNVEDPPAAAPGGGLNYCFGGPHPVDTRVVDGPAWDESQGRHLHPYPPFDLRLFVLREGCYHFVGDPTDFGYRGQTYSYYGAHPVLETYGGGWCFMIGGHAHWWRPWSPYFTVAGPWYYWYGPYDPFFWNHWPYYAHYYRAYYPRYYGGGRFYRGRRQDRVVAPPVGRMRGAPVRGMAAASGGGFSVPPMGGGAPTPGRGSWNRPSGWSSPAPANTAGDVPSLGWSSRPSNTRAVAPPSTGWPGDRGGFSATPDRTFRAQPQPQPPAGFQGDASGWSGNRASPAPSSGFRAVPMTPSYRAAPSMPAPSFRSAPAAPSFRSAPASPSFRSAPAAPSSGGFRGGGGFRSGGRR
jgi:hypothetical protein